MPCSLPFVGVQNCHSERGTDEAVNDLAGEGRAWKGGWISNWLQILLSNQTSQCHIVCASSAPPSTRKNEHARYKNSNFLVNLTEALSIKLLGHSTYNINLFVVYCIPFSMLSSLAEAFFTDVGQGYVANGGGFSHEPAGRSTAGATYLPPDLARGYCAWVLRNIKIMGNVKEAHQSNSESKKRLLDEAVVERLLEQRAHGVGVGQDCVCRICR